MRVHGTNGNNLITWQRPTAVAADANPPPRPPSAPPQPLYPPPPPPLSSMVQPPPAFGYASPEDVKPFRSYYSSTTASAAAAASYSSQFQEYQRRRVGNCDFIGAAAVYKRNLANFYWARGCTFFLLGHNLEHLFEYIEFKNFFFLINCEYLCQKLFYTKMVNFHRAPQFYEEILLKYKM